MRTTHTTVATEADIVQVVDASQLIADIEDAEALFKEAKRRERRRRLLVLGSILAILAGVAAIVIIVTSGKKTAPKSTSTITQPPPNRVKVAGAIVGPEQPYGLAVSPDGDLYVADVGRDQILRRLPSGKFQVVAGTGTRGISGDGGLAVDAELSLVNTSGIVAAKSGTIYFSDTGNNRVREVLPDGIIKTIAGGGNIPLAQSSLPAVRASLCSYQCLTGLAIGPDGDLYIAAGDVYRLDHQRDLQWVVGGSAPNVPSDWPGPFRNPGVQYDFSSVDSLAFDGQGDLIVTSGDWSVYEDTVGGRLLYLEQDRVSGGSFGPLVQAQNGGVLVSGGKTNVTSNGSLASVDVPPPNSTANASAASPLDEALGKFDSSRYNIFVPDGVAVSSTGTQYLDTNTGNTFTAVSAIVEVKPDGSVLALWRS